MSLVISIEGLDGVGKSTLVKNLALAMKADNSFYPWVYESKEPGSMWTPKGKDLRDLVLNTPDFRPLERELLFYVDASMHRRFIENQGEAIVLSDRGQWSHLAYLRGYLKTKQIDWDDYQLCKQLIMRTCRAPDCVIYLRGSLELMAERLKDKKKDVIESNDNSFYEAVLETYEDLVVKREYEGFPLLSIDATDSFDNVVKSVVNYLKEVFDHEDLKAGNRCIR